MALFIVVILILGIPFLIGFGIGRATQSSEPAARHPNPESVWRHGYAAGVEYEKRNQARYPNIWPHQHDADRSPLRNTAPDHARQNRPASVEPPKPPESSTTPAFSLPPRQSPSARPVRYTAPANQQSPTATMPPPPTSLHQVAPVQPSGHSPAEKRRRTDRNINITLYSATLLIVTASALFISAAVPASVIIGGLLTVTVVFYLAGLGLHAATPRLQPAAVAFVGTSVALVPINGLTWWLQSNIPGSIIWLLTSLLGLAMLLVATVRLQSTLGIYLTMPLIVSSVVSAGASLQRGYIWTLIFAIAFSLALTWLLRLIEPHFNVHEQVDQDSLAKRYLRAVQQTNLILVPLVVVASWFMPAILHSRDYFALYLIATLYFVHAVFVAQKRYRGLHISGSYVMGLATIICAVPAFSIPEAAALNLVGLYAAASAMSVYLLRRYAQRSELQASLWGSGTLVGITAAYIIGFFVGAAYQVIQAPHPPGTWNVPWIAFFLVTLVIVLHNLGQQHSVRTRMLFMAFLPTVVMPAYPIYSWSGFTAILTTVVIGLVLAVQWRWTKPQAASTDQPDKYWATNALAFLGILFATQIVRHFDSAIQTTIMVVTLLGFVWATVTLFSKSKQQPSQTTPTIIWTVATAVITLFNVAFGTSASLADPKTIMMYLVFGLVVVLTTVVAGYRLRLDTTAQPNAITLAATVASIQLVALALWVVPATHWIMIVALLVLAAWFVFLSEAKTLSSQTLIRLGFLVAGHLTVMSAGTLFVVELGGNGSLQRLVTALIAATGAFVLTWRSNQRFSHWQLAGHRGLVLLILASIIVAEITLGQDRLVIMMLLAAFVSVALLLGNRFGGGWFITPAIWFAAWNFSDYPRVFNGWIKSPLYSSNTLLWFTLLAAVVLFVLMSWQRHRLFDPQARGVHQQLQTVSSVVFLIGIGYVLALQAQPTNSRLALGALFISLIAALLYTAGRFFSRKEPIAGVLAALLIVSGYVYALLVENFAIHSWIATRSVTWALCFAALAGLIALVDYGLHQQVDDAKVRTSEARTDGAATTGIIQYRFFRQSGEIIVFLTALLGMVPFWAHQVTLSGNIATQALTTGIAAIVTVWILTLEVSRDGAFIRGYRFPKIIKWSGQTAAMMVTLSIVAILWWITTTHRDPYQARYWLFLILSVAVGLWSARFMFNSSDQQRTWRNSIWIAAAVLFTGNSLTLLSSGTALMQLSGLLGFAALLALDLIYNYRVLSIWGAVGITAAVLWYLRDLTYVWIGLLGIALLAAAIWQLRRTTADNRSGKQMSVPYQRTKTYEPPPPPLGIDQS